MVIKVICILVFEDNGSIYDQEGQTSQIQTTVGIPCTSLYNRLSSIHLFKSESSYHNAASYISICGP